MTPAIETRAKVERLEAALLTAPQVDCPVRHYFAPGLFAREVTIPAGTCAIGVVHKTENIVVLASGRVRILTDNGPIEVQAPHVRTVKPGQKNAVFAIEAAVWINFFPNPDNETDINVLAPRFTEAEASDLLGGSTNRQLAANKAVQLR